MLLEVTLLGKPSLQMDGSELILPTRKSLALLAYLALEGTSKRSKLADLLWGELGEDDARKNLRQELHRLSKTPLGPLLEQRPDTIALGGFNLDVQRFRTFLTEGNFEAALKLYQGPLLEGLELRGATGFDEWLPLAREALAAEYGKALEHAARAREAAGNVREALEAYLALLAEDELQERYHRETMRLQILLGQREAALKQYERCQAVLRREFALEPLPETVAVAERARARELQMLTEQLGVVQTPVLESPLIGRDAIWQKLEQACREGKPVLLAGEAGVGKSRLLREFASSKGRYHLNRGQPHDANVPFSTLSRAIRQVLTLEPDLELPAWVRRELSRLVPELSAETMPAMQSEGDRLRLFDAFSEYLMAVYTRFDLLISDDLQYFDASSLEMGNFAAARLLERGIARPSVATVRFDGLTPAFEAQLRAMAKSDVIELIELEPLDEAGITQLMERLCGDALVLFPRRLHASTGGNPFFVLETLRTLFESGELFINSDGIWTTPYDDSTEDYRELPIPATVRETILARSNRLGSATRRLLEVGSLASEPFQLSTVAGVSALAEWEALEALEQAILAGLLRETVGGYQFVHDLMRRTHAEVLGVERRHLIHRRLAQELEMSGGASAQIAVHLEQAGRPFEAAPHWAKAALAASALFNLPEALGYFTRALELASPDATERFEWLLEHERLARELGERQIQHADLDALEGLAITSEQLGTVLLRRSNLWSLTGQPQKALEAAERAYALLEPLGGTVHVQAMIRLAEASYYVEDFSKALEQASQAVELAQKLDLRQLTLALNWQSILYATLGQPQTALEQNAAALEAWQFAASPILKARLHNNRATMLNLYGSFQQALENSDAALEIATRDGLRQLEGFARDTRVRALRGLERFEEASHELESAIALGTRTGNHRLVSHCLCHRVQLLNELGDFHAALEVANRALETAASTSSMTDRILTLTARASTHLKLNQAAIALEDSSQAMTLLESGSGMREALPETVRLIHAQVLEANRHSLEAESMLKAARTEARNHLEQLRDPELRRAFLEMAVNQILLGVSDR